MKEVSWLSAEEQRAWRALQFMQMRLEAQIARQLSTESNLSYADYLVLLTLTDQEEGRLRAFEVGHQLGWEKSRLSHQVTRMATRGLVRRAKCVDDRRGAYVELTAKGRRAIEAAAPGHVAEVRRLFVDALTPAQLRAVGAAAQAVLDRLDDLDSDS